jgi:glycine cleavage system H protein
MSASIVPDGLKYSKDHEWVKVEGNVATIGITDHAQHALGDIVFLEVPKMGADAKAGKTVGVVESVKAASDIYSPVSGKVIAVNAALANAPETINKDCYGAAWMAKIEMSEPAELDALMDPAAYAKYEASL